MRRLGRCRRVWELSVAKRCSEKLWPGARARIVGREPETRPRCARSSSMHQSCAAWKKPGDPSRLPPARPRSFPCPAFRLPELVLAPGATKPEEPAETSAYRCKARADEWWRVCADEEIRLGLRW